MLRPAMSQIIREGESYYAFVVAVARHAREIADYWADNGLPMEKNRLPLRWRILLPVKCAFGIW